MSTNINLRDARGFPVMPTFAVQLLKNVGTYDSIFDFSYVKHRMAAFALQFFSAHKSRSRNGKAVTVAAQCIAMARWCLSGEN